MVDSKLVIILVCVPPDHQVWKTSSRFYGPRSRFLKEAGKRKHKRDKEERVGERERQRDGKEGILKIWGRRRKRKEKKGEERFCILKIFYFFPFSLSWFRRNIPSAIISHCHYYFPLI